MCVRYHDRYHIIMWSIIADTSLEMNIADVCEREKIEGDQEDERINPRNIAL